MEKLPTSINKHIFRLLSHPVADAIRKKMISEFRTFSSQYGSSDLHTFYIFFVLESKINALPKVLGEMYERLLVSMGIDSNYIRPGLWELYESHFVWYFSQHDFVDNNRANFRSNQRCLSSIIIFIELMSKVNKLTTSCIIITNAMEKS